MFARGTVPVPGAAQGGQMFNPAEIAAMGRNGDSIVAHLTPGEITIPPQLQNPRLLAELSRHFQRHGVDLAQFTAGSPASSPNPETGAPQYNFMSALLPTLLGIGGGVIGSAIGGPMGGMAGASLGSGGGTALTGGNAQQSLLSGLGSGLGYGVGTGSLGDILGGGAATGVAQASPGVSAGMANALGPQSLGSAAANAAPATASAGGLASDSLGSQLSNAWNTKGALGTAFGANLGYALAAPTEAKADTSAMTGHMPAVNSTGGYNARLGNFGTSTTPTFNGYDPQAAMQGGGYRFFKTA
jgi:hypothetical protein